MTTTTGTKPHPIFLAGRWVDRDDPLEVANPADADNPAGATFNATEAQYEEAVEAAVAAFEVTRDAAGLRAGRDPARTSAPGSRPAARSSGRLIALEAGKPIRDALVEVDRAVADLPPRRRGGRADGRRDDPARPDARLEGPDRHHPALPDRPDRRRSARSTSRSTWPPTRSRRRSPSGNPIVLKPPSKDPLTMLTVAEIIEEAGAAGGRGQHPADDPRARRPDGQPTSASSC